MRIAIVGYGKMGKEIEKVALERGHTISAIVDDKHETLLDELQVTHTDVAVEFTQPEAAVSNYIKCFEMGIPVVSGTTGWLSHFDEVKSSCLSHEGTLFYASNFSIGVNILFEMNRKLAGIMNGFSQYDVEMEEIHHIHKKDAPSGTAISLATDIIDRLDRKSSWGIEKMHDSEIISINSLRQGDVPGTHHICYKSPEDIITLKHEALGRRGFAVGAVVAAEFSFGRKGMLSMQDLLSF